MSEIDYTEKTFSVCEPLADGLVVGSPSFDRIIGVGAQSLEELNNDLRLAEKEMKDPCQWDTFSSFMTQFKQTHATWFK